MGLFDKLQAKLEIYRLEQRYTRRKNRSTFTTAAQYVDGEYVFPDSEASSPVSVSKNSTGSMERDFWRPPPATETRGYGGQSTGLGERDPWGRR